MKSFMNAESISKLGLNHPLIIPSSKTNGTGLCNASVLNYNGNLLVNIRLLNYTLYHSIGAKYWQDEGGKFPSRWGKHKHWIFLSAPIFMIATFLIFLPPTSSPSSIYFFVGLFLHSQYYSVKKEIILRERKTAVIVRIYLFMLNCIFLKRMKR